MADLLALVRSFDSDLVALKETIDRGQAKEADALAGKYEGMFARNPEFQYQRARLHIIKHEYQEALPFIDLALSFAGHRSDILASKATCLVNTGQVDEAMNALNAAMSADPTNRNALQQLLSLTLSRSGLRSALALLDASVGSQPESWSGRVVESLRAKAISLMTPEEIEAEDPKDRLRLKQSTTDGRYNLKEIYGLFEQVGSNCEFGLVQRARGAEPLSLFRWTSVTPESLVRLLSRNLEGYDDPSIYKLSGRFETEYLLEDTEYGTRSHTGVNALDLPAEEFLSRVTRRQAFLKRKFLSEIEQGTKTYVYKFDSVPAPTDISHIDAELVRLGARRRLYVICDGDNDRGGRIEAQSAELAYGYISSVMPFTKFDQWDKIVVSAYDHFRNG